MAEDYEGLSLAQMELRNRERSEALARQGVAISTGSMYLETLIETLLGDRLDEARRAYQMKVAEGISNAEAEVFKIRLGVARN